MQAGSVVAVVGEWQEAANEGDIERLLALSDPEIALVGPRGTAHGHEALREWVRRAGLRLTTLRVFARGEVVVAEQRGVWRSAETGEVVGEASVASCFWVVEGRVARVARYDMRAGRVKWSEKGAAGGVARQPGS
jgi:hypothetical protein